MGIKIDGKSIDSRSIINTTGLLVEINNRVIVKKYDEFNDERYYESPTTEETTKRAVNVIFKNFKKEFNLEKKSDIFPIDISLHCGCKWRVSDEKMFYKIIYAIGLQFCIHGNYFLKIEYVNRPSKATPNIFEISKFPNFLYAKEKKVVQKVAKQLLGRELNYVELIKFSGIIEDPEIDPRTWRRKFKFFSNGEFFDLTDEEQVRIEMEKMVSSGFGRNLDAEFAKYIANFVTDEKERI